MISVGSSIQDGSAKFRVKKMGDLPAGFIMSWAGNSIPEGWLLCDGSEISREDYLELFNAIGTTWGAGDGSTTFNLPNSIDRFIEGGSVAGTYVEAGLPNIEGAFMLIKSASGTLFRTSNIYNKGAFSGITQNVSTQYASTVQTTGSSDFSDQCNFDASRSNSIYGNSTTVQPPALTMKILIKY